MEEDVIGMILTAAWETTLGYHKKGDRAYQRTPDKRVLFSGAVERFPVPSVSSRTIVLEFLSLPWL